MAIILGANDAVRCLNYADTYNRIIPVRLTTGEFALPESVLLDDAHIAKRAILQRAQTRLIAASDIADHAAGLLINSNKLTFDVDFSKDYAFQANDALTKFDFEVHFQDRGFPSTDVKNNRDRSELNGSQNKVDFGTPFWASWATQITSEYPASSGDILIYQLHGSTTTKSPCIAFDYGTNGELEISTRSDAELNSDGNGTRKIRFTSSRPPAGSVDKWVINGCAGASGTGFLKIWRNGTSVLDLSIPLGYYFNDGLGPWPKWGVYRATVPEPFSATVYNPEWGTTDLSARISSPLSIPS